jgi:hypothetical protein
VGTALDSLGVWQADYIQNDTVWISRAARDGVVCSNAWRAAKHVSCSVVLQCRFAVLFVLRFWLLSGLTAVIANREQIKNRPEAGFSNLVAGAGFEPTTFGL